MNSEQTRLKELVLKTRSYRRFKESHSVDFELLKGLIDLARLSASATNKQPLKYLLFNTYEECQRIFPCLAWAGYLEEWEGPAEGERPSAYIIILGDKMIADSFGIDHGIAAQTIMLGANEAGLGGCMIASVERTKLRSELRIPERYDILLVLALGLPAECIILEEIRNNDIKYWRDDKDNHHVPKRPLSELIINMDQD